MQALPWGSACAQRRRTCPVCKLWRVNNGKLIMFRNLDGGGWPASSRASRRGGGGGGQRRTPRGDVGRLVVARGWGVVELGGAAVRAGPSRLSRGTGGVVYKACIRRRGASRCLPQVGGRRCPFGQEQRGMVRRISRAEASLNVGIQDTSFQTLSTLDWYVVLLMEKEPFQICRICTRSICLEPTPKGVFFPEEVLHAAGRHQGPVFEFAPLASG